MRKSEPGKYNMQKAREAILITDKTEFKAKDIK